MKKKKITPQQNSIVLYLVVLYWYHEIYVWFLFTLRPVANILCMLRLKIIYSAIHIIARIWMENRVVRQGWNGWIKQPLEIMESWEVTQRVNRHSINKKSDLTSQFWPHIRVWIIKKTITYKNTLLQKEGSWTQGNRLYVQRL